MTKYSIHILVVALLMAACSTTSHLPEGEVLYTGVDHIDHVFYQDSTGTYTSDLDVQEAVSSTLEVQPNSALLGSAYRQSPLPWGLWIYNSWYPTDSVGFRHWVWSHFKSDPTLVSQVNPKLRAHAAESALLDEGYFSAQVLYDTVPNPKNPKKAKLAYQINYGKPHVLGDIDYRKSASARFDSIVQHTLAASVLHKGDRFSVTKLEIERERISAVMRDSGYFFFKPEYIKYLGDTLLKRGEVSMRVMADTESDRKAWAPCVIDSVLVSLDYGAGLKSQNFDTLRNMIVGYNGPQQMKTKHLRRAIGIRSKTLYSPELIDLVATKLARLNTFKYTTTEVSVLRYAGDTLFGKPLHQDTTHLKLKVNSTYNYPWTGSVELGVVYKDNDQVGPGLTLNATRRNIFGGGEALSFEANGSYEWRTVNDGTESYGELINAFELGGKISLTLPRLQLPRKLFRVDREKPVSTKYSLSLDWTRRAGLFEMTKFSGQIDYMFYLNKTTSFTITPLKLTYVLFTKSTDRFDMLMSFNPALSRSFSNQFIPQIQFAWQYDSSLLPEKRTTDHFFKFTAAEAGGLCDIAMGWWGKHKKQGERQILNQPFSQFVKTTAEYRNTWRMSSKLTLASRVLAGVAYAYGNSDEVPYSEVFYIGGPNSLRGFSVRGIGPGHAASDIGNYSYLYHNGDIKFEMNTELRFPIAGILNGALFIDAGNVWRINPEEVIYIPAGDLDAKQEIVYGELGYEYEGTLRNLSIKDIALNTGVGLRLDLGMLVLRFDVGVPLHNPEYTDHYFNCFHRFWRNLGYNLAVGYPF